MPKGRGRKDSDSDAASVEQPVVGTFETLRDEGEHFVHVKQYQKAIESFTKALEMHPGDKTCLVTRSKCYLMLGNSQAALTDAEAALDQDEDGKKDIRALCMKAEALYQTGDFETALVYYHRGHKLRPELQDFRLGIQKSQEAINNSIGTPDAVKLEASGDLAYFYKQEEKQKQQQKGYSKPQQQKREEKKERTKPMEPGSAKTTKQLLGELFKDKAYLEKIYDSLTASSTDTDDFIKGRAVDGLEYLNMRADFWRQQKPMYARQRDRKRQKQQNAHSSDEENQPMQYILQKLEEIDEAQSSGKYEQSLKKSQTTLMKVEKWGEDRVQNKHAVVANLYSCIGNAYLEMEKYKEALDFHNKDLYLGREHKLDEAESRALDNLGRTNARMGKFDEAIDIWEQKLPKSKSALESTWLYHEIGRCYLELGQFIDAKDYGEKSCAAAKEADDLGWQLHSVVLLAQAEAKCKELQAAADSFERALEIAEKLKDKSAQSAIHVALDEINACIVKGVCEDGDEKDQEEAKDNEKQSDSSPGNRLDDKNKDNSKKADDRHNIMDDDQKDKDAKDKINEDRKEQKADNDRRRETEKQAAEEEKENDDIEAQDSNEMVWTTLSSSLKETLFRKTNDMNCQHFTKSLIGQYKPKQSFRKLEGLKNISSKKHSTNLAKLPQNMTPHFFHHGNARSCPKSLYSHGMPPYYKNTRPWTATTPLDSVSLLLDIAKINRRSSADSGQHSSTNISNREHQSEASEDNILNFYSGSSVTSEQLYTFFNDTPESLTSSTSKLSTNSQSEKIDLMKFEDHHFINNSQENSSYTYTESSDPNLDLMNPGDIGHTKSDSDFCLNSRLRFNSSSSAHTKSENCLSGRYMKRSTSGCSNKFQFQAPPSTSQYSTALHLNRSNNFDGNNTLRNIKNSHSGRVLLSNSTDSKQIPHKINSLNKGYSVKNTKSCSIILKQSSNTAKSCTHTPKQPSNTNRSCCHTLKQSSNTTKSCPHTLKHPSNANRSSCHTLKQSSSTNKSCSLTPKQPSYTKRSYFCTLKHSSNTAKSCIHTPKQPSNTNRSCRTLKQSSSTNKSCSLTPKQPSYTKRSCFCTLKQFSSTNKSCSLTPKTA